MSQLRAVIQRIDLVNREVAVIAGGTRQVVTVPSDCPVFLHGERVKLRLLQPGDRVHITYEIDKGSTVARAVEAQSEERLLGCV